MKTRRWPALALLLVVLAGGVRAGELETVAALQKIGARILRDQKQPGSPVVGVDLGGVSGARDADLRQLTVFPRLSFLGLSGTGVTDRGLKDLAALKQLQVLVLSRCGVTDRGLKDLAAVPRLRELDLSGCKGVTDMGLQDLAGLKDLQKLNLKDSGVTDLGAAELKKLLPQCEVLR
jgi:hypothetical protein